MMKSPFRKIMAFVLPFFMLIVLLPGVHAGAAGLEGKGGDTVTDMPPDGPVPQMAGQAGGKDGLSPAQRKLPSQLLALAAPAMMPKGLSADGLLESLEEQSVVSYGEGGRGAGSAQAHVFVRLSEGASLDALTPYVAEITNSDLDSGVAAAWVEVSRLEELALLDAVRGIELVTPPVVYAGDKTSEGVGIHRADAAWALGADGTGIKVGVISDGVDHLAEAKASGDLPAIVTVLQNDLYHAAQYANYHGEYDEGTAMLEVIHDLAPGAELYFIDCGETALDFNDAVDSLVDAGCTVICDDIGWITQPFFEDGIVARHIQQLVDRGTVVYASSAGNSGYAEHFQGSFVKSGAIIYSNYDPMYYLNNFSASSLVPAANKRAGYNYLYASLDSGESITVVLEWNDPWGKSGNDYDLLLVNRQTGAIVATGWNSQDGDDNPAEWVQYRNNSGTRIDLAIYAGAYVSYNPYKVPATKTLELYLYPSAGAATSVINTVPSDSIFGHAAASGVLACGAVKASSPGVIEAFSSQGPVTLLGKPTRQKPDICGVDGVSVTGAGAFPSVFYGTSAASPHVAAVAALVWSKHRGITASQVRWRIVHNAADLGAAGFDNVYGYGRADALDPVRNYYVQFDSKGGSAVAPVPTELNQAIAEPAEPKRTGYTFDGWYTGSDFATEWAFVTDLVTGDMTLVAKWNINHYTVTYNTRGGSQIDPADAEYGSKITAPNPAPTRAGFTFGGWYREAACVNAWNFSAATVAGNTTLYARWVANAPTYPRARSQSYNSAVVAWSAVPNASGYEVWRSTLAAGPYTLAGTTSSLTFTDSGLTTYTAYYYKIRAYDLAGAVKIPGNWSAVTAAVRPVPAKPTSCAADSASYSSIRVVWSAVAGAGGYEVWRASSSGGAYSLLATTPYLYYKNTGLKTGTPYYYKVRAYRTVNGKKVYGPYSDADGARPALNPPTLVRAVKSGAAAIRVTWGDVSGASGYEVWRCMTPAGNYALVKSTTGRSFSDAGLTAGQWYYYKVRAYRMVGSVKVYGPFSAYAAAKP